MTIQNLHSRWQDTNICSVLEQILYDLADGKFQPEMTPFGQIDNKWDFRGFPLRQARHLRGKYNEIVGINFENINFGHADFTSMALKNCVLKNVSFPSTIMHDFRDHDNQFEKCLFLQTKFHYAGLGYDGSRYIDTFFDRCLFRRTSFIRAEFDYCTFHDCNLKSMFFMASSFVASSFEGILDDVVFQGGYAYPTNEAQFGTARKNTMDNVSFKKATLHYVDFRCHCDLSTVILPEDGKHLLYDDWYGRLDSAKNIVLTWSNMEQKEPMIFMKIMGDPTIKVQPHIREWVKLHCTQEWHIVNTEQIIKSMGLDVGSKFIAALGKPVRNQ